MAIFTEAITENDAFTISEEMKEAFEDIIEGWKARPANLATWIFEVGGRVNATTRDQAAVSTTEMFKTYGQEILNVPPILAAPATAGSTWTATDDDGHTIFDGTEVKIPVSGGQPLGFVVIGDVTISPGDTATEAGEVLLQAIEPGEAGNGLTEEPAPITSLDFVDSIVLVGATSGGVDEEDEDAYLDRLVETLRLLSLSLIVVPDFETDARAEAGIARALCIPGYNPEDETEDNPLMFCVFPIDEDGEPRPTPAKEALQERQAAKVPSGVLNFVADPEYTPIDGEIEIAVTPGFEPAAVVAAVKAWHASYFSKARSGNPNAGETTGWVKREKVYFNEVIAEVDRIQGVDRVVALEICKGGGVLGTADVTLDGVAPLTEPGDVEVTVA